MLTQSMRGVAFPPAVCFRKLPTFTGLLYLSWVVPAPSIGFLCLPLFACTRALRLVSPVTSPITYDRWRRPSMIGGDLLLS